MTKDDLIKLKSKLEKEKVLSEEDRLLINQIISANKIEFGFASIDKPWVKFYNQEELNKIRPKNTIYQEVFLNNRDFKKDLAIQFFGSKINYKKLFKNIDNTAKSFKEYGIKSGDFVTICCAGIPEVIYSFYAISKIGAVANFMSPYFDKNHMVDRINDCESKTLIVMDKFYDLIRDSIKRSSIKRVIIIPTLNSSVLKILSKIDKEKLNFKVDVLWNQFIKDGIYQPDFLPVKYEPDAPLCMVYSSGTTGASKAILLSNDSFQNSIQSYPASGVDISRGQKFYQIIPPWFSTGLSTSIHLPLSYGVSVLMDPRFERNVFVKNVIKYRPNYAVAPTSMYEGFLDQDLIKKRKIIGFNYPFEGGELLSKEVACKIETQLKLHGTDTKLRVAYGQCECGAAITTQTQKINHPEGSVGIPLPGVVIGIFDDNFNELPYYERGQICVKTPCGMIEYYKNPEATCKYFHIDKCGEKWSCTGDIGYVDENGDLFIKGRMSDYTIVNGKKIYNFDIENVVSKENDIKNCDVIGKLEDDGTESLALHIIFNDETARRLSENDSELYLRLEEIRKKIYDEYSDADMVPSLIKIRTQFPYKTSGKRDIESIKKEKDGFIKFEKYNNKKIKQLCK